jgi:hypothetical protein
VNTAILKTFENTEEDIKIGQSGDTNNIGHKRLRKKNKSTTLYVPDTTIHKQTQITQSLSELVVLATILTIFQDRTSPNNTSTQYVLEIQ